MSSPLNIRDDGPERLPTISNELATLDRFDRREVVRARIVRQ
jgi:hypothetical protein